MTHPLLVGNGRRYRILVIPEIIVDATSEVFGGYPELECPVLWHGVETSSRLDVVTTVTIPHAQRRAYSYDIASEETERVARSVIKAGLVPLAQVHTHPPNCTTRHSPRDDKNALALGDGFLSLVFPNYGQDPFDLELVGIHERIDDDWTYLTSAQKQQRIQIVPSRFDFRRDDDDGTA